MSKENLFNEVKNMLKKEYKKGNLSNQDLFEIGDIILERSDSNEK